MAPAIASPPPELATLDAVWQVRRAIDALVLSGLRPTFAAPELDPELGVEAVEDAAVSIALRPQRPVEPEPELVAVVIARLEDLLRSMAAEVSAQGRCSVTVERIRTADPS